MLPSPSLLSDCHSATAEARLEALGDQIAELSAHIHAATFRLLLLIHEFDSRDGWAVGFRTCAHWLNWRTGINRGAAREKVRAARFGPTATECGWCEVVRIPRWERFYCARSKPPGTRCFGRTPVGTASKAPTQGRNRRRRMVSGSRMRSA